ncbi:MAG TPA: glycosyltransferase family 2 protein [Dehalococcoidia bacterium]|nr:glycosyltransferase family 2 protein [Dehalococcoidia bacterium]
MLPGALALAMIATIVLGYFWFPGFVAVIVLIFNTYWLWKSWTVCYHARKGVRLMRRYERTDWRLAYRRAAYELTGVLPWDKIRHVVIIPNYKENEPKLRATLTALSRANGAGESIVPVLAMEEAEPGAAGKGARLAREFAPFFSDFLVTLHPNGLPGEVRGKSSNEAWAARCAVRRLVQEQGISLDHLTVTSCDADTLFPPQYFECLSYEFATNPERYSRFWQAPIFFYNNIWQVPAPLRVPNSLSGLVHLSRLCRQRRVLFSQSTYSLSMRMAHDVGYWDVDIIPEDWHMFLKCFYSLGGEVDVDPIFLPVGNDGALSATHRATYVNYYLQVRRWGWGASDVPYAVEQALGHPEIPLKKRLLRCWYLLDNHLQWSTQWFFLTLGSLIPFLYWRFTGGVLIPDWFLLVNVPILGHITLTSLVVTPTLIPYLMLVIIDSRERPPAPPGMTRLYRWLSHGWWLATSPITLYASALPALDAQVRLMIGRRMEYRVTEKV